MASVLSAIPARRGSDAELSRIARADRGADGGDLVFRLEGRDPEFLQTREVMKERARRSDRIGAEEHVDASELAAGDQAQRERFRARDRAIKARLGGRGRDMVLLERRAHLGRLAISVAGVQRCNIGLRELRRLGEFGLQPVDDRLAIAVEHPERQAQRPHVLAAERLLVARPKGFTASSVSCEMLKWTTCHLAKAAILQRVLVVSRLGEVARRKLAFVGDDQPAIAQRLGIGLERRGVHRDQHVGLVAGRIDRAGSEIDLESGHPEGRALRRADFGREIGEGRKVVPR